MIDGHSRRDPTTDRVECTGSKVVHLTPHDDESMALHTTYCPVCVGGLVFSRSSSLFLTKQLNNIKTSESTILLSLCDLSVFFLSLAFTNYFFATRHLGLEIVYLERTLVLQENVLN